MSELKIFIISWLILILVVLIISWLEKPNLDEIDQTGLFGKEDMRY